MATWKKVVGGEEIEVDEVAVDPERMHDCEGATPGRLPQLDESKAVNTGGKLEQRLEEPIQVFVGAKRKLGVVVGLEVNVAPKKRARKKGIGVREPGVTLYQVKRVDADGELEADTATLPGSALMVAQVAPLKVAEVAE